MSYQDHPSYEDQPMDYRGWDVRRQDEVPAKLKIPAIFLIIVGVLNVLGALYFIVDGVFVISNPQFAMQSMNQFKFAQQQPPPTQQQLTAYGFGYLICGILGLVASALTIVGGARMVVAKSYALAMIGSVLAIIPCISCTGCCGLGEGIGIWALIVLVMPDVKAVFQ
jgi:hypothetical protein